MKTLLLILVFMFLGKEPNQNKSDFKIVTKQFKYRPTLEQKIQLYESKIKVVNSEIRMDIFEIKNQN
jgi:hypothetical protein